MEFASHDDIYVYVHMYIHMSSTGQYSIYCKHHLFMQIYICQKWDHITHKDFQPVPTPAPSVSVNIPLDYREWLRVFPCKESQDFSPGPLSDFFPTGNLNLTLETQSTHAHAYTRAHTHKHTKEPGPAHCRRGRQLSPQLTLRSKRILIADLFP